tara:strand:- start:217 stop:909 length:693 start_codon:yes stop_codon:yes gene_type:complete
MAIIRDSFSPYCLAVDPTFDTIHVSIRAPEAGGGGGYYRLALASGTITALAANTIFYAFRNPAANPIIVPNVTVGWRPIAGNTALSFIVSLYVTRSYTVLDTTGAATAPILKGEAVTQIRSTQMNALARISNTGALSGGTGTDDAQPLGSIVFNNPGSISSVGLTTQAFFPQSGPSSFPGGATGGMGSPYYPLVLAQDEGFRIRVENTPIGGTNTIVAYVSVDWAEVASF